MRSLSQWNRAALAGAVLLAGAGAMPAKVGATPARAGGPAGVLRIAAQGVNDITTLDPARAADYSSSLPVSMVYNTLVRLEYNPDGTYGKVVGDAASSWSISPDGLIYTFHLQPSLAFADGTAATATDFIYSISRALSPKLIGSLAPTRYLLVKGAFAYYKGLTPAISGLKATDAHTLEITLIRPTAYFLDLLTNSAGAVVERSVVEKYGPSWPDHGAGTGPFQIAGIRHNQGMTLTPNPHYFGGKAPLKEVDIPFIIDPNAAYRAYQTNTIDVAGVGAAGIPQPIFAQTQGHPDFHLGPGNLTDLVDISQRHDIFKNVHVRRAFSLALDKTVLARILGPAVTPTDGFLLKGYPAYNPDLRALHYDPAAARKELALAGYPGGKGFPLTTLIYFVGSPDVVNEVEAMQQLWQQVLGIQLRLRPLSVGSLIGALISRNFDLALSINPTTYPDPHGTLFDLQSQTGFWKDAHFDQLTNKADSIVGDDVTRYKIYQEAEQYAVDQAPQIPLAVQRTAVLISTRVHGLTVSATGVSTNDWTKVTVD